MNFNKHYNREGSHAFLSASKYSWIRYDEEKLVDSFHRFMATQKGTELHNIAESLIKNRIKLPNSKKTLNMHVNDAIGFKMNAEQILYYSDNCFGTADAICFKKNTLRIHDLKTGVTPTHIEQLRIYAALFCLEYNVKPADINMELRIYQNDQVFIDTPTSEDIFPIMQKIISFDKVITQLRLEES